MKNTDWKIFLTSLSYTYLFYQQEAGLNFLIFSLIIVVLAFLQKPENKKNPAWLTASIGTIISGFFVYYYGTSLPKIANTISLMLLAGFTFKENTSLIIAGFNTISAYILAIPLLVIRFIRSKFQKQEENLGLKSKEPNKKSLFKKLMLLLFPLFVVFVFFVLYRGSNPLFLKITEDINLDWLSFPLVKFFLSALLMMYAFFVQNIIKPINNIDEKLKDDIEFVDEEKHKKSFIHKFLSLDSEIFIATSLLLMLNLLIAFLNAIDINYLWLKVDLPQGLVFSDYLHSGTFTLIVSIVLAISVIVFFFRGLFNFSEKGKWIKILGYAWIFQNIIMIVSAMLRNQLYIADYGMTHKRIGVYIFLLLSVIGLLISIAKIALKQNTIFLIRKSTWAFYVVLLIATAFNWDMIITRHNIKLANIQYIVDLDKNYLARLSHVNTYALAKQESEETPFEIYNTSNNSRWKISPLQEKIQELLDYENRNNWQENCLNKNNNIQKLKELNEMGKIAKLDLYAFYLEDITHYETLSNIKAIDLQNNRLENNLKGLNNYKSLEVISLSSNSIKKLDSLPFLEKLTHLNLQKNSIRNFSSLEEKTPKLTHLNISEPYVELEEEDFPVLPKLESIILSKTKLDSWKFLAKQKALKEIVFTNSNVEDIKLSAMQNLQKIDLSATQLYTEFLDSLSLSKNIKEINFTNCSLGNINYLISDDSPLYPNLEIINLDNNYLNDKTTDIDLFKKLKELNLKNNALENLTDLQKMFSLTKLDVSRNSIKTLDGLTELKNLKELIANNCKIENYEAVLSLNNLEIINLSDNKIRNIDSLVHLKSLKELYLDNNKIKDISALQQFKNVTHLSIANNPIKDYSVLYNLKNLKYLSVGNIDLAIIEQIKEALPQTELDYFSNNLSKPINYNNNKRFSYSESF